MNGILFPSDPMDWTVLKIRMYTMMQLQYNGICPVLMVPPIRNEVIIASSYPFTFFHGRLFT
jgi:hypothetical protein